MFFKLLRVAEAEQITSTLYIKKKKKTIKKKIKQITHASNCKIFTLRIETM